MIRSYLPWIFLVVLFACSASAQEGEEESSVERIVQFWFNDGLESLEFRGFATLFESDELKAVIRGDDVQMRVELIPKFSALVPRIAVSTTLPNPYMFSPAYENVGIGPRHSLNIDVITGKYYWEW